MTSLSDQISTAAKRYQVFLESGETTISLGPHYAAGLLLNANFSGLQDALDGAASTKEGIAAALMLFHLNADRAELSSAVSSIRGAEETGSLDENEIFGTVMVRLFCEAMLAVESSEFLVELVSNNLSAPGEALQKLRGFFADALSIVRNEDAH